MVARGDLPEELRDTVASMDAGDLRGPVRSERGFHILQLWEKKTLRCGFDEVKRTCRRLRPAGGKGIQSWTKELRRKPISTSACKPASTSTFALRASRRTRAESVRLQ